MSVTLFGIHNCDTVRKARRWLDEHSVDYRFHDLRKDGLDQAMLNQWAQQLGWETLVNRRSSTWRQLDAGIRDTLDEAAALQLMLEQPTLIKRPLLDKHGHLMLGFSDRAWTALF